MKKKVDHREEHHTDSLETQAEDGTVKLCSQGAGFIFFWEGESAAWRDFCKEKGICFHNNGPIHIVHFRT